MTVLSEHWIKVSMAVPDEATRLSRALPANPVLSSPGVARQSKATLVVPTHMSKAVPVSVIRLSKSVPML